MDACDTPDCNETLKELDLFLDAELSDGARTAIHHHLDSCPDCLSAYDFHAELKQVIHKKCQPTCCRVSKNALTPISTTTESSADPAQASCCSTARQASRPAIIETWSQQKPPSCS